MADLIGTDETTEEDADMVDGDRTDDLVGDDLPSVPEELAEPEPADEVEPDAGVPSADEAGAAGASGETPPAAVADEREDAADPDTEDAEDEDTEPAPVSPYDMPGDWYVIHSYSGYENKVKVNLESRISSMHMEDRIFEVHIPMEDVVEIKNGKKVTVPRKVFPGYILVRMTLDDDSWYTVRNTPGVTGFVGGSNKPTPLSRREVERFLGFEKHEEKPRPRFKPEWEVGEVVRVVMGPFADFNGKIEGIDLDQSKVTVLVNIFGRDTPVELGFGDIQKS